MRWTGPLPCRNLICADGWVCGYGAVFKWEEIEWVEYWWAGSSKEEGVGKIEKGMVMRLGPRGLMGGMPPTPPSVQQGRTHQTPSLGFSVPEVVGQGHWQRCPAHTMAVSGCSSNACALKSLSHLNSWTCGWEWELPNLPLMKCKGCGATRRHSNCQVWLVLMF